MKKITFLFTFLVMLLGYSQNVPIDFESTGNGATWTWTVFENDTNPPLEIITNPFSTGINTSSTVAKYSALQTGGKFAGFESQHGADIGTWTVTSANAYVKVMVYQEGFASQFGLKFARNDGGALVEEVATVSAADEWVELTFDMSDWIGNALGNPDQIIFFVDNIDNRPNDRNIYIDNVTFNAVPAPTCSDGIQNGDEEGIDCGGSFCPDCPPPPTPSVSAPTPTPTAGQVINKYSDTYNPGLIEGVTGTNWAAGGNYASAINSTVDGNPADLIKGYNDLFLAFINWDGPGLVDASTMNYFHIDVWTANGSFINVKLENQGANLNGNSTFPLTQNVWNSIDINLNTFGTLSTPSNRNAVFQLILDATAGADIFIDNVYFSQVASLGVEDFEKESLSIYPNPSNDNWNIKSSKYIVNEIEVFNVLGKSVMHLFPNSKHVSLNASQLSQGLYFTKIITDYGNKTIKVIKN